MTSLFIERPKTQAARIDPRVHLEAFLTETDRAMALLNATLPEVRWLSPKQVTR